MDKAQLKRALQIGAALLIVVLAIGLYKAKADASKTERHVRELRDDIAAREAELRELRSEIAQLESPERIEALAESKLGMVVGSESAALPQDQIDNLLPAPRQAKARE